MRLNKSNDCEFKHAKHAESDSTINKYKADVEALKEDILKLKVNVQKKTSELGKLSNEITKGNKIVKNKDNEMSKMKETFNKSLQDKNEEIAWLKKEVATMAEEIKTKSAKVISQINKDKDIKIAKLKSTYEKHMEVEHEEVVKCKYCPFTSSSSTVEFHAQMAH
jgi:HAMP domain-containing protein